MSLQGSLDTFALPDVLVLLASTTKSGELYVTGQRVAGGAAAQMQGRLWFDTGRIVGSDVQQSTEPADAVFELLRLTEGTFSFAPGTAPSAGAPVDVEPVLTDALARLAEWREIEKVVPSLAAWLELAPELPGAHTTLRGEQWRMVVAVAGGRSVESVLRHLDLQELPGCRAVKEMIEAGLLSLRSDAADAGDARRSAQSAQPPDQPQPEEAATLASQLHAVAAAAPAGEPSGPTAEAPGAEPAEPAASAPAGEPTAEAPAGEPTAADEAGSGPAWRNELGDVPDLDALVSIPARRRRRTEGDEETQDQATEAPATLAEAAAAAGIEGDELLEDGDEPLNRGLLLKFLSSVRN